MAQKDIPPCDVMAARIGLQANVVHQRRRLQQRPPLRRQAVAGEQVIE